MSGDEGGNIWWNGMRTIVHTYLQAFTQGFWNGPRPIECQFIGTAKLMEKGHQKRLIMLLQGPNFKSEDTCTNSIHCPVWPSLKNRGKLLGDCSRP